MRGHDLWQSAANPCALEPPFWRFLGTDGSVGVVTHNGVICAPGTAAALIITAAPATTASTAACPHGA
jgi:hypothetical protein